MVGYTTTTMSLWKNAFGIFNCMRRDLQLSNKMGLAFLTHFSQHSLRLFKMF